MESILVLDRLRQSVAVKEIEQTHSKQQLMMRKTASVPNFSQVSVAPLHAIIPLRLPFLTLSPLLILKLSLCTITVNVTIT